MKRFLSIMLIAVSVCGMAGCGNEVQKDILESEITRLESHIETLKHERDMLENEIVESKIEKGLEKYVICLNIKQTHFTLDLSQHLKDEINAITIEIPVDKEYFDNVEVGDVIDDSFRMGSLIFKGSWGSWEITVADKDIR